MENFTISSTNPNDATGGGGCLCTERKSRDCTPPYVVFNGDELTCAESPYPVACRTCLEQALWQMDERPDDILPVGDVAVAPDEEEVEEAIDDLLVEIEEDEAFDLTDEDVARI